GSVTPPLWFIGLAESANFRTLVSTRIMSASSGPDVSLPVRILRIGTTAARWTVDLSPNNGASWFQDEVGKFFNCVLMMRSAATGG
ncbi:hypothetical protein QR510_29310, partial [Escherichia coli]|uniref:hypothetical protein n=1 Tax=Escherichia coli TaxID=562 RepID=UPI0027394DF0